MLRCMSMSLQKKISRVCGIYEVHILPSRENHRLAQKHERPENETIVPSHEFSITSAQTLANKFRNTLLHAEANLLAVLLTYSATPQNYLLFFTRKNNLLFFRVLVTPPFRRDPLSIIPVRAIPSLLLRCEKIILSYSLLYKVAGSYVIIGAGFICFKTIGYVHYRTCIFTFLYRNILHKIKIIQKK